MIVRYFIRAKPVRTKGVEQWERFVKAFSKIPKIKLKDVRTLPNKIDAADYAGGGTDMGGTTGCRTVTADCRHRHCMPRGTTTSPPFNTGSDNGTGI